MEWKVDISIQIDRSFAGFGQFLQKMRFSEVTE